MAIVVHDRAVELETEADAYEFLEQLRWGDDGPTECPHCASVKGAWFLKPKDPEGRKSKGGSSARSHRRVWKCRENSCRRQFSVLTNTVMHATKLPVRAWVGTVFDLCSNPDGVSARDIADQWGVTPKSAFAMLTRLQDALASPQAGEAELASPAPHWFELDLTEPAAIVAAEHERTETERRAAEQIRETQRIAERVEHDVNRALLEAAHTPVATPVSGANGVDRDAVTRAVRSDKRPIAAVVVEAADRVDSPVPTVAAVAVESLVGVAAEAAGSLVGVAAEAADDPVESLVPTVAAVAVDSLVGVAGDSVVGGAESVVGVVVEAAGDRVGSVVGVAGDCVVDPAGEAVRHAERAALAAIDSIVEPESVVVARTDRAVSDVEISAESTPAQTAIDTATTPTMQVEPQSTPAQMDLGAAARADNSDGERGAIPADSVIISDAGSDVAEASRASASDSESRPKLHDDGAGRASHPTARATGDTPKARTEGERRTVRPATDSGANASGKRPTERADRGRGSPSEQDGRRAKRRSNRVANEGPDAAKRAGDGSGRSTGRSSNSGKKRPDRDGLERSSQPVDNSQKRSPDRRRAPGELGGANLSRFQERRNRKRQNSGVEAGAESLGIGWLDGSGEGTSDSGLERPRPDAPSPPARGLELGPEWALSAGREAAPSRPASDDPVSRRAVESRGDSDDA